MTPARVMAAWSLLGCACAPDDAQRYDLGGLTVIEDFDEPICAGTFPYFERRLRWLGQETDLPRDPRGLTYRWYLDQTQVEEACSFSLGGCTKGRTIFGNLIAFSHELVHAHLARLGSPRVWLEEGMATMLEDERSGAPHSLFTPSVMMRIDDALELDYDAASAFTTYLRDRYGMPSLLDYYEASADTDAAMSLAIFEEVLGDTFADVEADYLDGGLPDTSGSLECDGPDVAWGSERWEHMTRYFGVFANRHHLRPRIIPPSPVPTPGQQLALGLAGSANDRPDDDTESSPRPRRLGWAKLLARVFAVDVTLCRKCGGSMRIREVVETDDDIARVLHGARAPPGRHPAPSSRTGLVVPQLTARSGVALDPACRSHGQGGRGDLHRAPPSCNTFQNSTTEAVRGRAPGPRSMFTTRPTSVDHSPPGTRPAAKIPT